MCFKSPKSPEPPPPPPPPPDPPDPIDPGQQAARRNARKKAKAQQGFEGAIKTGARGDGSPVSLVNAVLGSGEGRKTLG